MVVFAATVMTTVPLPTPVTVVLDPVVVLPTLLTVAVIQNNSGGIVTLQVSVAVEVPTDTV